MDELIETKIICNEISMKKMRKIKENLHEFLTFIIQQRKNHNNQHKESTEILTPNCVDADWSTTIGFVHVSLHSSAISSR